jgi:hypothetical protein
MSTSSLIPPDQPSLVLELCVSERHSKMESVREEGGIAGPDQHAKIEDGEDQGSTDMAIFLPRISGEAHRFGKAWREFGL